MKKFLLLVVLCFLLPMYSYAQEYEEVYKGRIDEVFSVECSEVLDEGYSCFEYSVEIDGRDEKIRSIPVMSDTDESRFNVGDMVYVSYFTDGFENDGWSVTGFVRGPSILAILLVFSLLALIIGRKQGFGSILSLAFTIFVLYIWAIPNILAGGDVILIGVATVCITLVVIMYLSHGFNRKSNISVLSTLIGILIVSILAKLFISITKVDGLGSEEAFLLHSQTAGNIDLAEIFFVSILIGSMGVLDDVVISQISSINELHVANPQLTSKQLFLQAMNIGRDHLSSMVNTLFIAYAGSSFALVILLTYNSGGIGNILGTDAITEEIVRTLSASIGILLVVPITSLIASYMIPRSKKMI